jgi:ABC-2 type transport system permease protein
MTTTSTPVIRARHTNFAQDVAAVATRALKLIPRDIEGVVPALIVPVFFFAVNLGSLSDVFDALGLPYAYTDFQLPVAIIFAVTGVSRASTLVIDIQDGYFDRMLMTPMKRLALLLGLMVSDFVLVGVRFDTGVAGILLFLLIAGLWGLVFTGFPYAIALKTGSPAAVNSSFILFFPFAFLTTAFTPEEFLTGWLGTVATYNPVTYILAALRSLIYEGWEWATLVGGLVCVAGVGVVSMSLAFAALRGRVKRG